MWTYTEAPAATLAPLGKMNPRRVCLAVASFRVAESRTHQLASLTVAVPRLVIFTYSPFTLTESSPLASHFTRTANAAAGPAPQKSVSHRPTPLAAASSDNRRYRLLLVYSAF